MPSSTGLTSIVRKDPLINNHHKLFRRLGRHIHHVIMPISGDNLYPSQSCEDWASHIFNLLDTVLTFRPTCLITNELIPAQEIGYWPEYGEWYVAYIQLINSCVIRASERNSLFPIPEWPAFDCLFTAEAFEVAAVSYRDQMERSIQRLYDTQGIKSFAGHDKFPYTGCDARL